MVKMSTGANQSGLATGSEGLVCFVCDVGVVGRYYSLATCKTQTTKVRLIEKLGQLVGEEYMVIISQEDIICRGCATMINSLDRLEKELGSIRSIVLRYLEKKYELQEGELVNARANIPVPTKGTQPAPTSQGNDFQSRKKRMMMGTDGVSEEVKGAGRDSSWLQCDKCKYTTNHGSYMAHHARTHAKRNQTPHEGGGGGKEQSGAGGGRVRHESEVEIQQHNQNGEGERMEEEEEVGVTGRELGEGSGSGGGEGSGGGGGEEEADPGETVEMIAAEIGGGQEFTEKTGHMVLQLDNKMTLQAVEGEDGTSTLCMVDENGLIVQKVEQAEDGTLYVHVPEGSENTKQVLSVAEDGSVQMVEVLWDDMVTADESDAHGMVTF